MSNTAIRQVRIDWHGKFAVAWLNGQPHSITSPEQLWRLVAHGVIPVRPAARPSEGPVETVEQFLARGGKITPGAFPEAPKKLTLADLGLAPKPKTEAGNVSQG